MCILAAIASSAVPVPAAARSPLAEIVVDAKTGRVIHEQDADRPRRPASIAKVMTLFLVFDALDTGKLKLDQRLRVSRAAAAQAPTKLGLAAGGTITVRNAMRAVAVKSANDAAVVLAEALAGDERRFARKMTAKARALGMAKTAFGNATGLPDRKTWTTARDIATLSRAVWRAHPDRYALFGRRTLVWRERSFTNHNHLLGRVTGVDGIKTGFTNEAGYTVAASAARKGRRLIAVVLGAVNRHVRDDRAGALLERGFAKGRPRLVQSTSPTPSKLQPSPNRETRPSGAARAAAAFSLNLAE
jgi:D-alanyl-D-alanine carboxypeptidase